MIKKLLSNSQLMVFLAFSILPCLVMLFYGRPLLLLYSWPVVISVSATFLDANMEVDGFATLPFMFLPMDVVYFFTIAHLTLYAVLQPNRFIRLLKDNRFLTLFLGLILLYVVIYTPIHGKTALGEARKYYFMFLFPFLALTSVKNSQDLRRLMLIVVLCAASLVALGVVEGAVSRSIVRILNSAQTLIIACALSALVIHQLYERDIVGAWADKILIGVFSIVVLWSGQRSVWLACVLAGILMLALYRHRSTTVVAKAVVIGISVICITVTGVAMFPTAGEQVIRGFEGILAPTADQTASWRIEAWRQQIFELASGPQLLFGNGLGSYFRWEFDGQDLTVAPHNAYIETLVKLGLVGLTLYGLLVFHYVWIVLAMRRRIAPGPMKAYMDIGLLNFGAAHAYFLGYGFVPITPVFLALAIVASKLSARSFGISGVRAVRKRRTSHGKFHAVGLRTAPSSFR